MRWKSGRRSSNVEDRRGMGAGKKAGGIGIGTIIIALIAMYFGIDPSVILNLGGGSGLTGGGGQQQQAGPRPEAENELADMTTVVLADTEDTWNAIFKAAGKRYKEPKLVMFTGAVKSACGMAEAAMGPFYCPADQKVYIDLSFYEDLKQRHGAPGDFAQAYVVAHEVGHHVQNLLGISDKVHQARRSQSKTEANRESVKLELQADCFAGVWANHAHRSRQLLEQGDVEEALTAASAIGDDRLQKQGRGYVTPDSFTHGSSAQRVRWFKQGIKSGNVADCNTFNASSL